jgi:copper chaperone
VHAPLPNHRSTQVSKNHSDAVTLRVGDMACAHCAATITNAIETGVPATTVKADPASKLVTVVGSTNVASIKVAVVAAGFTPEAV